MRPFLSIRSFVLALTLMSAGANSISAQRPPEQLDGAAILHRIQKLGVVGSVLYVAAHPDDENTRLISSLSNGHQVRTAYLSLTRGDGGQNLIGPELGDPLGVIRTQELLEARRIDGGEQFFTRAVDFGYSKSPEETLSKWGEEEVLADVVRVVRMVRPDVIVTRFPPDGRGGHGHHTASAILAHRAFELAGDPAAFPEQIAEGLAPWQPRRVFFNSSTWWNRDLPERVEREPEGWALVEVGGFDPLLGASYTELAGRSRSQHKSQGFGAEQTRGSQIEYLELQKGDAFTTQDLFEGIDLTWSRFAEASSYPNLPRDMATLEEGVLELTQAFDPTHPERSLGQLLELRLLLSAYAAGGGPAGHWAGYHAPAAEELALQLCGIVVEARSASVSVAQGEVVPASVRVLQRRSGAKARLVAAFRPDGSPAHFERDLVVNEPLEVEVEDLVAADDALDQPFWLARPHGTLYDPSGSDAHGIEPRVAGALRFQIGLELQGHEIVVERELMHTWVDRVEGERTRPTVVTPIASIEPANRVAIVAGERIEVVIEVEALVEDLTGTLEALPPAGWSVESAAEPLEGLARGERRRITLGLRRSAEAVGGPLRLAFRSSRGTSERTRRVIEYGHIMPQTWYTPAEVELVPLDIGVTVQTVGYVEGVGDDVPNALQRLGVAVERIDPSTAQPVDLKKYDAIVTGIRAYNTVQALAHFQPVLLDYVENGGTLLMQYNTGGRDLVLDPGEFGPYPFALTRGRVTVEEAPATLLAPNHPVLTTPNHLGDADFEGWVQERGLYFTGELSPEYTPLIAWNDPGEEPLNGALITCDYGKGRFTYTGISLFRQLPAGVPGAYRLLANLLARRTAGE